MLSDEAEVTGKIAQSPRVITLGSALSKSREFPVAFHASVCLRETIGQQF